MAACIATVLLPFITVALPYRRALYVQAGVVVVLMLALICWALLRGDWSARLRAASPLLVVATGLYALVALLGTAVGLAGDASILAVGGQFTAMALLPLGALVALTAEPRRATTAFLYGMAGSVAGAALAHVTLWWVLGPRGAALRRITLPNSASAFGASLLGLLAALVLASEGSVPRARRFGRTAAIVILVYIIASGIRGLWIVTVLAAGAFLYASVHRRRDTRRPRRRLRSASILTAPVIVALAAAGWWLTPRENLAGDVARPRSDSTLPRTAAAAPTEPREFAVGPGRRSQLVLGPREVNADQGYRVSAELEGSGTGSCTLALDWLGATGEIITKDRSRFIAAGLPGGTALVIGIPARGSHRLRSRIACNASAKGAWTLSRLRLEELGPRSVAIAAKQLQTVFARAGRVVSPSSGSPWFPEPSLRLRAAESLTLTRAFMELPVTRKLIGRGLGATFVFTKPGRGPSGERVLVHEASYVHNFFLFLLYKLGLVGTVGALASLALFMAVPFTARRARTGCEIERRFLAACSAAWVGYLVWAVASPEIIDFRVAPLLGLLVGCAAGAVGAVRSENDGVAGGTSHVATGGGP